MENKFQNEPEGSPAHRVGRYVDHRRAARVNPAAANGLMPTGPFIADPRVGTWAEDLVGYHRYYEVFDCRVSYGGTVRWLCFFIDFLKKLSG